MLELAGEKTEKEYMKKGVKVEGINGTIYPMGVVWMPTSERYFQDYLKILNQMERKDRGNMLDLGCGSGILSFLFAKHNKKWAISALDNNPAAISTTNINASKLNLSNIHAFEFDLLEEDKF
jgi:methylase of polypeptide subunit release factors